MPIRTAVPIHVFDQESFHDVDRRVTGISFRLHNALGRYLDEKLYQRELTRLCRLDGMTVEPEMCITVSSGGFSRDYFADHLLDQGVIIETKVASGLGEAQRGQVLNYLYLCGLHHATLLNFGAERVQHVFVSTGLTHAARRRLDVHDSAWKPLTARCTQLPEILLDLLSDWGAFLAPSLYKDGCSHFLGGDAEVIRVIDVRSQGEVLGRQPVHLLTEDVAFSVTASTRRLESVREHQRRFLHHTDLKAIQWINLNHHKIQFHTITK